jgi:hypothetical protein
MEGDAPTCVEGKVNGATGLILILTPGKNARPVNGKFKAVALRNVALMVPNREPTARGVKVT